MLTELFTRGFRFARENPQILYTLVLAILIPAAFFWTSEQFLRVTRENQDRLERSRIALLSDAFVMFSHERFDDPEYLEQKIKGIINQDNENIVRFDILMASGSDFVVFASNDSSSRGQLLAPLVGDGTAEQFAQARTHPNNPFSNNYFFAGERMLRTVRSLPDSQGELTHYMLVDYSMGDADRVSQKKMRDAYSILVLIVILIVVMLARQAKIIDYATLYKRLEGVDRMKDDFVSMAAHELRSPLTVIRGYVDLLGDLSIDASGKQLLKNIDMAAQQLNALVGDILDVSKLQEGRMSFKLESLDPAEHIAMVVDSFKKPAADKGLTLTYIDTPLPKISVDPDRIRQILINLVGNAVKYTPSGSVTVKTAVLATGRVEIRVSDTGMGISAEDQKKLFQKFYRVKNVDTEKITGTGLGLWITAQIVEAMKGTITVESIRGKGSDFILTFPPA